MNLKNAICPLVALAVTGCAQSNQSNSERPNIIIILADDMGFSDLSTYGGEVETPHLDRLAHNGLRFKQFYNTSRSCPTRGSLMTGLYPHQAGTGWMAAADMQRPAYQGYLNNQCVTIGEALREAGYATWICGKWHLSLDRHNEGGIIDGWPLQRGFDKFYGIVGGAANFFTTQYHYGNEPGRAPDDGNFYFTHALNDSAASFILRHDFDKQPFFLYLSHIAPHWPLHALPEDIEKYVDRYWAGWDQLREERFERQKNIGLFGKDVQMTPRDERVEEWESLTHEQKHEFVMRMAIYAAQIDAMDQGIGRIIAALEEMGQLDNTMIVFLSDNGACAEHISSGPSRAVDGKANTWESYRIQWANLSSTPYREYKHWKHEGGIATPLIVHYPNGIRKRLNNSWVNCYGHIIDLMPTAIELARAEYPKTFNGNAILPMEGISLTPSFSGKKLNRPQPLFGEHQGSFFMRDGKWKLVAKTEHNTTFDAQTMLELFDMEADPTELNDLSEKFPERKQQMYQAWLQWAERTDVLPLDTRDYGQRQRDYKRIINGEFDMNFGGWDRAARQNANVEFVIDQTNVISGDKTARIDVISKGESATSAYLRWTLNQLRRGETVNLGFTAKADRATTLNFRFERMNMDPDDILVNETIRLTTEAQEFNFNDIQIPHNANYQLVFYVGTMDGTCWIDKVTLEFE